MMYVRDCVTNREYDVIFISKRCGFSSKRWFSSMRHCAGLSSPRAFGNLTKLRVNDVKS